MERKRLGITKRNMGIKVGKCRIETLSSSETAADDLLDSVVQLLRIKAAPSDVVQFASVYEVKVNVVFVQLLPDMFPEVQSDHPAIFDIVKPLLVVAVVGAVKV
jgi:hypothetical protein